MRVWVVEQFFVEPFEEFLGHKTHFGQLVSIHATRELAEKEEARIRARKLSHREFYVSERWLDGLPPEVQALVDAALNITKYIGTGLEYNKSRATLMAALVAFRPPVP